LKMLINSPSGHYSIIRPLSSKSGACPDLAGFWPACAKAL
jgi:hypothetical protein